MEETSGIKPPGMQRHRSQPDYTNSGRQNQRGMTTDGMGKPYRTPSPARRSYVLSSNTSSPSCASQSYDTEMDGPFEYRQGLKTGDSALTLMAGIRYQEQTTTSPRDLSVLTEDSCHEHNGDGQDIEKLDAVCANDEVKETNQMEEPTTPTRKHVPVLWHGLLSPQTPGFPKHESKTDDTCLSDDTAEANTSEAPTDLAPDEKQLQDVLASASQCRGNDAERATSEQTQAAAEELQQTSPSSHGPRSDAGETGEKDENGDGSKANEDYIERDEALARQLEESPSPTPMRRSARLHTKPKPDYNVKPSISGPRPARRSCVDEEPPVQPEPTIAPCKSDPIPFQGLPTVHSVSWQLQYPPGGSTHPSYPYPALDPRLIFHQPFVPVVNGLPDITRVPKLVLPMNWRHVSWSGLLPIVFDPYHQAFKLTPVGPLPLTCEELHQAGLHKYVPGGELHPEYGMLPDMRKLSDGSDAEVFDFDGVDWTLPWEGQRNFHAPSASGASSDLETPCPWREARDCPDMVIDLADAWRWLSTKETDPTADFIPTPGKTRRGTGAMRLSRALKAPLPTLMMQALLAPGSSNPILANQDYSNRTKPMNLFCPFKSIATPANVDITLLGDTDLTLIELLCFFPQHYYWHHAADRLFRAGIPPSFIRSTICSTRGLHDDAVPKQSTIASAVSNARKRGDTDGETADTPTPAVKPEPSDAAAKYTAEGWTYDGDKIDYPVLALAHGLQALPTGVDAGPLTAVVRWCRAKERYRVLLSEVPGVLREAGIEPRVEVGEGEGPDKEVVGRYAEVLRERRRARRAAGGGKRAAEESVEEGGKRKRVE